MPSTDVGFPERRRAGAFTDDTRLSRLAIHLGLAEGTAAAAIRTSTWGQGGRSQAVVAEPGACNCPSPGGTRFAPGAALHCVRRAPGERLQ